MATSTGTKTDSAPMERVEVEFTTLTALREVMATAQRQAVSYPEAMSFGAELYPELLSPEKSLLYRAREAPAIRAFREKAEAASILEKMGITPQVIIKREIKRLAQLISLRPGAAKDMQRELATLYKNLKHLEGSRYSEHNLIATDVFSAARPRLPKPPVRRDRSQHYELGGGRSLNIRMLHPDKPEHICGADVVYEVCSLESERARVAFAQYKVWENESLAYSQIDRRQLDRLRDAVCDTGFCRPDSPEAKVAYRLPYCSAFLRLTDRLQRPESRLISAGWFVPICRLPKMTEPGSLRRADITNRCVSSDMFEAALVESVVGSDWRSFEEIENLYKRTKIFEANDKIIIHAQEY